MRCQACRRPLTNAVSIKHGLGPDCLRRAVKAGTAPLDALEELKDWQRSKPSREKRKAPPATNTKCPSTADLFEQLRAAALDDLNKAVTACKSMGITVTVSIEEMI